MTSQRQQKSGPPPRQDWSAMGMANSYLEDMGISDPEEAQRTQQAAMMVAEYLHGEGHTLVWTELDPPEFFKLIAFMSDRDREGVALILMGFYVWLCARGIVLSEESQRILAGLVGLFPRSEILRDLHGSSLRMLKHLAEMPLLH